MAPLIYSWNNKNNKYKFEKYSKHDVCYVIKGRK